ncbi:phospholipid phosphatase-related protein type 1 isoform X3 [Leopardus geoffroyi]|uniref:phospholipid phosphatase-related protein type 1 isoform X3 n=1 Tax=Herpailurus yagouaroundi TaxID=1608482 RepID=UPI001AD6FD3E|nr:phospholipid phosphatase-related protein type 1 isoform X3 [Puma yagouaroundi]XP_045326301.1 phospholipid phosphatase-related protein type 1 isoform X3 [Leopardus geoffroyi]
MAVGNNTQRSYSIIPCFIFVELVIMAGTVLLAYYFECTDTFQVHIQGFFCQDGDLMKPYPGTEEESFITPLVLYCVLAATPTAIIFIGEISMYFIKSTRESLIAQEKTILTGECCYLNPLLRRIIRFIGVFAFGLFATDIFVNAGQVVTGHLTPYFLTVCKPNYTSTDCRAHHQFINNGNICTGDMEVIEKARRSFPSKHAALSIYSALYATMQKLSPREIGKNPQLDLGPRLLAPCRGSSHCSQQHSLPKFHWFQDSIHFSHLPASLQVWALM